MCHYCYFLSLANTNFEYSKYHEHSFNQTVSKSIQCDLSPELGDRSKTHHLL